MKSVIIGTAGHIDHGKTALVKALTGIDADRLEEEKRRGITIDIGFAHLELPAPDGETLRLGFVDVPGHERFVRNMLAGVGGIDLVLLAIAADESIKPQTREHFDICRLLAVKRSIVVLTKSDLVDRDTLDVVTLEVEEFLHSTSSAKFPIIAVSSLTGAGLDELKQTLAKLAAQTPARDAAALARLPIDRVFSMKGFGTVATGTLIAGTIRAEGELELFPSGRRVRVRGVQVHGEACQQAVAGQRTALNLAGAQKDELARGMVLATPAIFQTTARLDVWLSLLASAKILKNRSRVHLHAYTWETIAEVRLLGSAQLKPGESGFAQLRLANPTLLLPGDRFIIRQFSPVVTIGGGAVLDSAPLARKVPAADALAFLQKLENGTPQEILYARVARRRQQGLPISAAVAETGWNRERLLALLAELRAARRIVLADEIMLSAETFRTLELEALAGLAKFHDTNALVSGVGREVLREQLGVNAGVFAAVVSQLAADKKLEISRDLLRLPGRGVAMKDEEAESRKLLESAFATAGLKVPALYEVLAGLKVDKIRAQKIVTLLLREKVLVKIADELVFHRDALDDLRRRVVLEKAKSPQLDVARFKDITGVSRKYAIPLLEYLDRERVTRRAGNERVIL
jgi:selenocysteine-specific elongation factor